MARIKHKRLKAATLVETIIAMVIILVIFGIVTSFLVQVSMNSFSVNRAAASEMMDVYVTETDRQKAFFDEEIHKDKFTIRREVVEINESKTLASVKFDVYDGNGHIIKSRRQLFYLK